MNQRKGLMKVADYLKDRNNSLLMVKSTETVGRLARQLQQHRVGVMIVSDDGRSILGIISERDIAYSLADRRGELHLLPVSALMTRRVITCSPEDHISEVMHLMVTHHIRHVPVVKNDRVLDMISMRDLIEYRLDRIEKKANLARHWQMLQD